MLRTRTIIAGGIVIFLVVATLFFYSHNESQTIDCSKNLECWNNAFITLSQKQGILFAFVSLKAQYEKQPAFRPLCFKTAQALADYAVKTKYSLDKFIPELATCNFGFFQEYTYSLLLEGESPDLVRDFCDHLDVPKKSVPAVRDECFRGIGRGLPFVPDLKGKTELERASFAVKKCQELSSDTHALHYCYSGLFNIIGRVEIANGSGLSVHTSDPVGLCHNFPPDIESLCFGNMKWTTLSLLSGSSSAERMKSLHVRFGVQSDEYEKGVAWGLGYEQSSNNPEVENYRDAVKDCAGLQKYATDCVMGYR